MKYSDIFDRLDALLVAGDLPACKIFSEKYVRALVSGKILLPYQLSGLLAEHLGVSHAVVLKALLMKYNPDLFENLCRSGLISEAWVETGEEA